MEKKSSHFSGQIGFVLAAAGSAVGVGNLWRFPYLAAKDGGGLFLLVYLVLVLTFGFTLLTSDIAIGRKTQKSAIGAYTEMHPKWKFLGILTFLVPVLIMTYYAVIGGWITKYAVVYLTGQAQSAAQDNYFTSFITSPVSPVIFALLFMGVTAFIVYNGVQGGIEKVSKFMMPVLLVLVVVIAIYSLTLRRTDETGAVRTGLQGFLYYITPHVEGLTIGRFLQILLDAMSQLFFSLSVSMGIMITYGSYVKKDVNLNKAVNQIEFFDTGVALLAGAMIIPAVFVFSGTDGMGAGPSLMFVSLPKVFAAMGAAGIVVGALFFISAIFATLTSCTPACCPPPLPTSWPTSGASRGSRSVTSWACWPLSPAGCRTTYIPAGCWGSSILATPCTKRTRRLTGPFGALFRQRWRRISGITAPIGISSGTTWWKRYPTQCMTPH